MCLNSSLQLVLGGSQLGQLIAVKQLEDLAIEA